VSETLEAGEGAGGAEAAKTTRSRVLQERFKTNFARISGDPGAEHTVIVVPSLTFDEDVLAKIAGVHHYEERMLCLLLLLGLPRTRVIYVTSNPVAAPIIDYYLHLLTGIPARHARKRLVLLSCYDGSNLPLTAKILARPRLIQRIREAIPSPASAHVTFFTVTPIERQLALELDLPFYGCDPGLSHWGSKSGSRKIFKEAQIPAPNGFEDLRDGRDVAGALAGLKRKKPQMRRALVKLNEGVSGEGNAIFDYAQAPEGGGLEAWVLERLPHLAFETEGKSGEAYLEKFQAMGGIVEEFIEGETKRSPSAQFRVDPLGHLEAISTHDQILGGGNAQIFLGCHFPADAAYRLAIQEQGFRAGLVLAEKGVLGRFAIDFISVKEGDGWRHYAIEINLRKGGTTHPFLMLQFLTGGHYDPATGLFLTPSGRPCFYDASDNLQADRYRGLTPPDFIDIAVAQGLHFNAANQEGVVFHLLGALSEFGKLGILSIGGTAKKARALYRRSVEILDRESSPH
jgi:PGM1 C-terminal domain